MPSEAVACIWLVEYASGVLANDIVRHFTVGNYTCHLAVAMSQIKCSNQQFAQASNIEKKNHSFALLGNWEGNPPLTGTFPSQQYNALFLNINFELVDIIKQR